MTWIVAGWLVWWLGGVALAIWAWAESFNEVTVQTVTLAVMFCTFLGPITGLLWWPESRPLWKRKR